MYSLETPATQDTVRRPNEQKINPTQHKTETKGWTTRTQQQRKQNGSRPIFSISSSLSLITLIKTRINPENKTPHSIVDIVLFLFLLVTELLFILKCLHIGHPFTLKLPPVALRDCPIEMTGLGFGYLLLLNLQFEVSYFVDHYFFFRS